MSLQKNRHLESKFKIGLTIKIVLAIAVVLALFIILTEITVSSIIKVSLWGHYNQNNTYATNTDYANTHAITQKTMKKIRKPILIYLITGALLALLFTSILINRIAVKPIKEINRAINNYASNKPSTHIPVRGAKEFIELSLSFNALIKTVNEQKSTLQTQLDEIKKTSSELIKTRDQLIKSAKLASVGTLSAGVAHEIGNPIAGVLGLIDAIEHEQNHSQKEIYLSLIKKEIRRIDKTISDLLNFSRSAAMPTDNMGSANLNEVLSQAANLVSAQKEFKNITVKTAPLNDIPLLAISSDNLTGIFVNLLLNAGQAMNGKGEILINATFIPKTDHKNTINNKITDTNLDAEHIKIEIIDSGPGIPLEYAENIFEPFFSKRTSSKGSGLGLAICQSICEKNGGTIYLDKSYQSGAKFILKFKVA